MEYYVVIEGQKQGPYDLLALIKKVKNGQLTAETLVSDKGDTGFRPAIDFEELKPLLKQDLKDANVQRGDVQRMSLKEVFAEGIELWSRRVIEYTMAAGMIIAIGFGFSTMLKKVQALADYPVAINFMVSLLITWLFCIFFYYVLVSKRSQEPDMKDFSGVVKKSLFRLFAFSALFSLYTIAFEFGLQAGIGALALVTFLASFLCFVPFLVQDNELRLRDAMRVSIDRVKSAGSETYGIILTLVAINLAVALIPALISKDLFVFGLFISIPITVSALAYIYDRVFA